MANENEQQETQSKEEEHNMEEEETEPAPTKESRMEKLINRMQSEKVPLQVHDIIIKGNTKTKESVIEAEIQVLKTATSMQEMLQAATIVNARLRRLDIFDSVTVLLDAGPPELPGFTNVVIEVVETKSPFGASNFGVYKKARSWSLEGIFKLKNMLGYADIWDGALSYSWDQTTEVSAGVTLPRFMKMINNPVVARVSLLSQDWLKSSFKEQSLGLSLGLWSTRNHDLSYNLSWRTVTDPSQMASMAVRRQLGHNLLSHLNYTYKIDTRNSPVRPTRGFAFVSTSQLGGIFPDYRSARFIRQEFDIRKAVPLGFARAALNFGVAGGVIFPWGNGFSKTPVSLPDRFFMGGNSSPVCTLGGPTSLLGFKTLGLGPSLPRREAKDKAEDAVSERDYLGGDLAVTAFADLSFDLPLKVLREAGIHGHAFANVGSLVNLTENSFRDMSLQKYRDSFRSSVGVGIVVPTKMFRMEINYCHILKQNALDRAKTGIQFSFSSPF
uniref:sorting and assembly machinery component 50 homolog B-like n=1 Tax=Erigeron canadensis TaxID=72917 RepID=UPI001CB8A373|nr:sorting and assembly machinery component 50 homolog B-like [Erigeron canadensis]